MAQPTTMGMSPAGGVGGPVAGAGCGWPAGGVSAQGRRADNPAMSGRISSPRLVGRAAELARLAAALADAAGGQPRCVLLGGEAGIGKTRLLAEFTTHAHAQEARVLSGACVQVGEG